MNLRDRSRCVIDGSVVRASIDRSHKHLYGIDRCLHCMACRRMNWSWMTKNLMTRPFNALRDRWIRRSRKHRSIAQASIDRASIDRSGCAVDGWSYTIDNPWPSIDACTVWHVEDWTEAEWLSIWWLGLLMFQSTFSFSFQLRRQCQWIRVRLYHLPFLQPLTRPGGSVVSL